MFRRLWQPKFAFYLYFGFFFLAYLWLFSVYTHGPPGKAVAKVAKAERRLKVPLFNGDFKQSPSLSSPCVDLRLQPPFTVCVHDPAADTGFSATLHSRLEWEPELTAAIQAELSLDPSAVFLDVGAFVGYYALLAASRGHRVVAVDPFPENLALLAHSVALNGFDRSRIELVAAAAAAVDGELSFVADGENLGGRFALTSDQQRFNHRGKQQTKVRSVSLDSVVSELAAGETRVVAKLDVEGTECAAILGAAQLLSHPRLSLLVTEWEQSRRRVGDRCVQDALALLRRLGFAPSDAKGRRLGAFWADPACADLPQDILWRRAA